MEDFISRFPSNEQIESLFMSFEQTRASHRENAAYRMQNYMNCVDDYSWGGLCDQAQDERRQTIDNAERILKNQKEHGCPFIEEFRLPVLTDIQGNIVSDRIVEGRFGSCWIIEEEEGSVSFVSLAKKPSTYEKKGYKVMELVYTTEYYYTTKLGKNGLIVISRVLSKELKEVLELPKYKQLMPSALYWALNN